MSKIKASYGVYSVKGRRDYMEDKYIIINNPKYLLSCIFDGHGGVECSNFFTKNFPGEFKKNLRKFKKYSVALNFSVKVLNNQFLKKNIRSGTTANIILIDKVNDVYHNLNMGDSRAILGRAKTYRQISKDHKLHDPKERRTIKSNGGFVSVDQRLNGVLAMSRSLGDRKLASFMNKNPDMFQGSTKTLKFIVHGSDGLFDELTNKTVYDMTMMMMDKYESGRIAQELVRMSYKRGSYDNITCSVILFKK